MNSFKNDLILYSNKIGLDLIGFTSTAPFERFLKELDFRKEHYQERYAYRIEPWKKQADPKQIMPAGKTVIVVGFYYFTNEPERKDQCGKVGRIVSYGHLGILKRAKLVCKYLQECGYKAIMGAHRKEAAVRAGLGAIGKNGLILNKKYGGWVAYQSIVTNAEIQPDKAFTEDLCGNCDACLKACPLSAIYEPYRVDPRRCISYLLTSEEISEKYWPKMGESILGCDACLEACPKNRGLTPKEEVDSFFPDNIGIHPPIKKILNFNEDTFQEELIGYIQRKISNKIWLNMLMKNKHLRKALHYLMKTFLKGKETLPETFVHASGKLMIYKRNALIAAGNLGDISMLDDIIPFANDSYLGKYAEWSARRLNK